MLTIARKRKPKRQEPLPEAPAEPRKLVMALTIGEAALALVITWLLFRGDFATHATSRIQLGAADAVVLIPMGIALAFFVFLLAFWQWRISARGRWRLLVVMFVSLLWSFCGLCWHDVSLKAHQLGGPAARSASQRLVEETAAASVAICALVAGMAAVLVILVFERRRLNSQGQGAINR